MPEPSHGSTGERYILETTEAGELRFVDAPNGKWRVVGQLELIPASQLDQVREERDADHQHSGEVIDSLNADLTKLQARVEELEGAIRDVIESDGTGLRHWLADGLTPAQTAGRLLYALATSPPNGEGPTTADDLQSLLDALDAAGVVNGEEVEADPVDLTAAVKEWATRRRAAPVKLGKAVAMVMRARRGWHSGMRVNLDVPEAVQIRADLEAAQQFFDPAPEVSQDCGGKP